METTPMSDEHKAALAEGRRQGRAVRDYLAVITQERRRGPPPATPEQLKERIAALQVQIDAEDDAVNRLELVQKRLDLEDRLAETVEIEVVDIVPLEEAFVSVAKAYSDRKGLSYTAWREIGVSAPVLKRAGVPRTRRTTT